MNAVIINIEMNRENHPGVNCRSTRPIVVWGVKMDGQEQQKLRQALLEVRQLYGGQSFVKSQSDIIAEVCDALYPNHWAFAAQGNTLTF